MNTFSWLCVVKRISLLIALLFGVSACVEEEVARDKAWYMSNADALKIKVEECKNDASIAETSNCKNALSANSTLALKEL